MSLLLDALKKAADDKNKKSDNSTPENQTHSIKNEIDKHTDENQVINESVAAIEETTDDSLELELSPETLDSHSETSDAFPEVNESTFIKNKSATTPDKSAEKHPNTGIEFNKNNPKELEPAPLELTKDEIVNTDDDRALNLEATEVKNNDTDTPITEKDNKPEKISSPDSSLSKGVIPEHNHKTSSKKVENEQALSALINKSNQYSRNEKLKKNITIGILIALILIGSGLYFCIEMQTSSQDLFIEQKNNAIIEQNLNNLEPKTASAKKPEPATTAQQQTNSTTKIKPPPQINTAGTLQLDKKNAAIKKPIHIVRTKKSDPVHLLLRDAYNAFHKQNYHLSENLYKKALKQEPKNRDALLGLAAIATKKQRYEYARQKYQYLLKLNPRDSIAIAGMNNLKNQINPQLNESQLKFMLKQQPDSAHLYFALGTLYSTQNRWPEAQSSYFSAWSAENKTADYAYNLAVSLDHLDKKQQALNFYQLSLKLKQASSGNFSQTDTESRIRTLNEALK